MRIATLVAIAFLSSGGIAIAQQDAGSGGTLNRTTGSVGGSSTSAIGGTDGGTGGTSHRGRSHRHRSGGATSGKSVGGGMSGGDDTGSHVGTSGNPPN